MERERSDFGASSSQLRNRAREHSTDRTAADPLEVDLTIGGLAALQFAEPEHDTEPSRTNAPCSDQGGGDAPTPNHERPGRVRERKAANEQRALSIPPAERVAAAPVAPVNEPHVQVARAAAAYAADAEWRRLQKHLLWPVVFSRYLQVLFNAVIVALLLWWGIQLAVSVQSDVQERLAERMIASQSEVQLCQRHLSDNKCDEDDVVPGLIQSCYVWRQCAQRNPGKLGTSTRLLAEVLGDVINGFVEPITYKTLTFFVVLAFGLVLLGNIAFRLVQAKLLASAASPVADDSHQHLCHGAPGPQRSPPATPMQLRT